ncbi:hypothetical protein JNB71_15515 [Rhizobium herbae]|uniref:Uncharacterized protein n=1 Tax=Rhizobium herbae TaxID=508661 RepID=A0ABS7HE55_9HYPH|nr:hypothetical protein [Rhizobium herbae]MBW9064724.1 hypothetical protein [Rhizobium herbae]
MSRTAIRLRHSLRLEAAHRLKRDRIGVDGLQPADQFIDAGIVIADSESLTLAPWLFNRPTRHAGSPRESALQSRYGIRNGS